jgi:hypothetical protein
MEYVYTAVSKMLRLTNDDNLIVNKIVDETPDHAVVFLTAIDLDDGVKVNYAKFQGIEVVNESVKKQTIDLLAKI